MRDKTMTIVIGGEAGQGLATAGRLLVSVLARSGRSVFAWQEFESRIRGGHNTFSVSAGENANVGPRAAIDILVALSEETADLHKREMTEEGIVIRGKTDSDESSPGLFQVPFKDLASDQFTNAVALGVVFGALGLDRATVMDGVEAFFGPEKTSAVKSNQESVARGMEWAWERGAAFEAPSAPKDREVRAVMSGHDAVALGALSAGLKFYSFYPMSPSTSIGVNLTRMAKDMGIVVEQCEDEIAVLNMALGASFAGAPSMVGTSGGGFALMTEAVSLAGISETPIVIVVGQRPGPATGLATRTAQEDLEFVLSGGHGEFPRAIFAPGTVEECFHLTRKAFYLAGVIQGPVIILTDQFLADCYTDVELFPIDDLAPVTWGYPPFDAESQYLSYRLTETGVSPRLFPGLTTKLGSPYETEQLVIGDSHEHTEDGHMTEDMDVTRLMVEKRMRKEFLIRKNILPLQIEGDPDPDILFVSWGSTVKAVRSAMTAARRKGLEVGSLRLAQVWPLPAKELLKQLRSANRVVCVESNVTGQLASLIRRETGFSIERRILRYDGRPMTPEWILRELEHMEGGSR